MYSITCFAQSSSGRLHLSYDGSIKYTGLGDTSSINLTRSSNFAPLPSFRYNTSQISAEKSEQFRSFPFHVQVGSILVTAFYSVWIKSRKRIATREIGRKTHFPCEPSANNTGCVLLHSRIVKSNLRCPPTTYARPMSWSKRVPAVLGMRSLAVSWTRCDDAWPWSYMRGTQLHYRAFRILISFLAYRYGLMSLSQSIKRDWARWAALYMWD